MDNDLISRQAVSSWLKQYGQDVLHGKYKFSLMYIWKNLMDMPPAQPEPSIPLSWIENEIKWLKSLDNTFSEITALQISAMVNKWRDEQGETD